MAVKSILQLFQSWYILNIESQYVAHIAESWGKKVTLERLTSQGDTTKLTRFKG
jgi:hypothetical protein